MQVLKNKIHNNYKKCDQAKNKVVLVEAGWEKNNRCNGTKTSSIGSNIRPVVVESTLYRRCFRPVDNEIKKKQVTPLMAEARKQLKNIFRK